MSYLDHFRTVRSNTEMADALAVLREALTHARVSHGLDASVEAEAQSYLMQAVREVNMPVPSKEVIIEHLSSAQACLSGQTAVDDVTEALTQAVATVEHLFT